MGITSLALWSAGHIHAQQQVGAARDTDALRVRRVIVLAPPPKSATPPTLPPAEQNLGKYTSAPRKKRASARRRLFTLPHAPSPSAPLSVKAGERQSGAGGKSAPPSAAKTKIADIVPADERNALAQSLLTDMLSERLHDRLGLTVISQGETDAALKTLHLNAALVGDAAHVENTRRLCALLNCQAIFVPRLTSCQVRDGLTREVTLHARVTVQTVPELVGGERPASAKTEPESVAAAAWPAQIDTAGASQSERVLFHSQYQKPQGDLIRDAAGQAANLFAHALGKGEQAPFARLADRLAVTPVLAPSQADKLMFTPSGRRVVPAAIRNLNMDVSDQFTPFLLPLTAERIAPATAVRQALAEAGMTGASLWQGENRPNIARVQALAQRLHVDYVLLARITDVELAEGATDPAAESAGTTEENATAQAARQAVTHTIAPSSAPNTRPERTAQGEQERAARVEAAAALVRAVDGAILWRERATATMSAPGGANRDARSRQTDASLIHDATRFALIELARRFRHYRADFEK